MAFQRGARVGNRVLRRGSWLAAGLASVLAAGALAACSSSAASSSSSGSGSADKKLTIGIVELDPSTTAAQREVTAVASAMHKIGWTVKLEDPQGQPSQANTFCTQYATQHVSAIIIDVFTGQQMAQCLASAKSAKVPVFFLASGMAPGAAGALQTAIPGPINDLFVKNVAHLSNLKILSLEYSPGSPCLLRQQYEFAALKKAGVSLSVIQQHQVTVPGQVTDAEAATTAWLNAHPASAHQNLQIWACFSDPGIGALAALNQANRKVPIYTWDLTKQVIAPLKSGQIVATSISDAPYEGTQMIALIKGYLAGGKPKLVQARALVLTHSNIDAYTANNPVS